MNKTNIPEHDLDNVLKQTLKDDVPPEAEARMSRHFLNFKRMLDQTGNLAEPPRWLWMRGAFRNEVLAFASAVMLIAGGVMQLSGNQSVLANSIERLKMVVTVSAELRRTASMDCTVLIADAGHGPSSYRMRWGATGTTRVDMGAHGREERMLWISDETVSMAPYARIAVRSTAIVTMPRNPVWQPALEFLTPAMLAQHMETRYGLIQARRRDGAGQDEVLLVGQENRNVIEITVDAKTYLPKILKKYSSDSDRAGGERICLEEVGFQWNQPIPRELLAPKSPAQD